MVSFINIPRQVGRVISLAAVLLAVFLFAANAGAEAAKAVKKNDQVCTDAVDLEEILPADRLSVTEHLLQSADFKLPYQATAGTLPIKLDENNVECRIFFISYHAGSDRKAPRPLTFVFNGGPGASSAYLHMGALGPQRVLLGEDGNLPGPPARLVDNQQTWLRFTDLVFVDPAGTGYSRCRQETGDKKHKKAEAQAWDVKKDLTSLARFIRLYLTRHKRWLSPKYLVGESYGGYRVAALSDLLQTDYDISLNGIVLVSPALEFELLSGNEFNLLPWVVRLPSYAAAARQYGKAAGKLALDEPLRKSLKDAEHFAVQELLPALAAADTGSLQSRLADFIGLPVQRVAQLDARVPPYLFSKELLRDTGQLVSVYDSSVSAIDPDPASPFPPRRDPLLMQLNTLLAAAFNSYVREQLQFETDIPYNILNWEVSNRWNWRSGLDAAQGYTGVAGNLKNSMSGNMDLRVLIGVFDLVTPYFGSVIVTGQMSLDPAIVGNLSLQVYEGGHMFYTNPEARQRFYKDAQQFFTSPAAAAEKKRD
jgi:carboxypeptidase C (cathepsin A)